MLKDLLYPSSEPLHTYLAPMKRLLFIFILISLKSFAQGNDNLLVQDTLFFDKVYEEISKEKADIIRIIYGRNAENGGYSFKEFDKDGKLEKSGITKERKGSPVGVVAYYYENGVKKEEGSIDKLQKNGLWKSWYQNGQLKEEVVYEEMKEGKRRTKMINYYDSTGIHLVADGKGLLKEYHKNDIHGQLKTIGSYNKYKQVGEWLGYHENGDHYYNETYNDEGELVKGVSYDSLGNRFEYSEVMVNPFPSKGLDGYYRFLAKNMKYPKAARKNGIQGRVYVQFVVDKEGDTIDVVAVKGISKECDEEAVRVISMMEKWKPGLQRGQPVKVRMVLPILFKLN